jgi:cytoplasmic iron level regulating protein YaaA (DUF328/UPF0246 family)
MLILLSPAKTLDFETPPATKTATQPELLDDSEVLVDGLKEKGVLELASLMNISERLAGLNHARFADWKRPFDPSKAKQAVLAFKGDVYVGLDAESFSEDDFDFAQDHVRILSGLYGVVRPLDLILPYRLEMGTKFKNERGRNLYEFWDDRITEQLNRDLERLGSDVVINLASNEYFKSVNTSALDARVVSPAFKDLKNGTYKVISFYAKRARGLMTAWIVKNRVEDPAHLAAFDEGGYRYSEQMSTEDVPVFLRD